MMKLAAIAWCFVFWICAALSVAFMDLPRVEVLTSIGLLSLLLGPAVTGACIATAFHEGRMYERGVRK